MKKLNIFNNKRSSRENMVSPTTPPAAGDTLNRLVTQKEEARRQWMEREEEFRRQHREFEIQMCEMEQAEVRRREEEVRRLGEDLDETKRKNRKIQDTVLGQIEMLQKKLEEYKLEHKKNEESLEDDITSKEDKLASVKASLERRLKALECDMASEDLDPTQDEAGSHVYPTLPIKGGLDNQNRGPPIPSRPFGDDAKDLVGPPSAPPAYNDYEVRKTPTLWPQPRSSNFGGGKNLAPSAPSASASSSSCSPTTSSRSLTPKTDQSDGATTDHSV